VRALADEARIRRFMEEIGRTATKPSRLFFAGGATAVLIGWRETTIDVDIKLVPDAGEPLRAVPRLKEQLSLNVELAAPVDFIPVPSGWEDRSPHIETIGKMSFHHFEFAAQAMSKIERGHANDLADVEEMLSRGLVRQTELTAYFEAITPELYRYPALDPTSFHKKLSAVVESST